MSRSLSEIAKAKVNLALHVLGRRADGYHELDSIVAFASVGDHLTVVADAALGSAVTISASGPFAGAVPLDDSNLIYRAHVLLSAHTALPPVSVELIKNLPVAAGIGGGSADAAAALRAFQRLAQKPVPAAVLQEVALKLGADVPVCLAQCACRMEGVGERLSPLPALPAAAIVLVNPGVGCATAQVFTALGLGKGATHRSAVDLDETDTWRNDLAGPALSVQPVIADVLAVLSSRSELRAVRMSGSGATCFGLAASIEDAQRAAEAISAKHANWWVAAAELG